jgi:hypothetical protein
VTKEPGGITPAEAIKALYRTGMSGSEVHAAAASAGVSLTEVTAGYQQSVSQGRGGPPETSPGVGPPAILPPGGGQRPCPVPPVSPPGFNVRPGGLPPRC